MRLLSPACLFLAPAGVLTAVGVHRPRPPPALPPSLAVRAHSFDSGESDAEFLERLTGSKEPQAQRTVTGVDPRYKKVRAGRVFRAQARSHDRGCVLAPRTAREEPRRLPAASLIPTCVCCRP